MRLAVPILASLFIASMAVNISVGLGYYNLTKELHLRHPSAHVTNSMQEFRQLVYEAPDAWLWHPEARGISRMRKEFAPQYTPSLSIILTGLHYQHTTLETTTHLLGWYAKNQQMVVQRYFPTLSRPEPYCDENAAAFRSMLMRMGIQSRVVNFQFTDGDGGAAHTALEVWLPEELRWVYVDAHYMAWANASALDLAGHPDGLTILRPENTEAMHDVFTNGVKEFVIEGHGPRNRLRLLQ